MSTPGGLVAFGGYNRGKPPSEQIRPFNFLLTCYPDRLYGLPADADPTRFRLVAPYESDRFRWVKLTWCEAHTGERDRTSTYETGSAGVLRVKTYGEIVDEYRVHSESKSVGPDGKTCDRATRGVLGRRSVLMEGSPIHVGKESNRLEERMRGELAREGDFLNVYDERVCVCGCGTPVHGRAVYADRAHRQRAYRSRRSRAELRRDS